MRQKYEVNILWALLWYRIFYIKQWFLVKNNFAPWGMFGNIWRHCWWPGLSIYYWSLLSRVRRWCETCKSPPQQGITRSKILLIISKLRNPDIEGTYNSPSLLNYFLLMEESHSWFLVLIAPLYISPNGCVQFSAYTHHSVCEIHTAKKATYYLNAWII